MKPGSKVYRHHCRTTSQGAPRFPTIGQFDPARDPDAKTALLLVDKVVGALRAGQAVEGVEPTEVQAVERARRALLWLEN